MMEAVRTSETSVDNHSTRQYNPEDSSEPLDFCCTDTIMFSDSDATVPKLRIY
jgi:hypothetical protein